MKRIAALALLLGGCGEPAQSPVAKTAGAQIEAAAVTAGLVPDAAHATIVGAWARDTDRVCIVPVGDGTRIGATVDYGQGQACTASGTVRRAGETLHVAFGACRFDARFDGERIVFPAEVPAACDSLCSGRASLAALTVERLSESVSEASTVRGANGKPLCTG